MGTVTALALIAWMALFLRRAARLALPPGLLDQATQGLVSAAAGVGVLTLLVVWLMMAWPGGPVFEVAIGLSAGIALLPARRRRAASGAKALIGAGWFDRLLAITAASVSGAIVLNAALWPFDQGDALALYAPFGRHLYESRSLPIGDRIYEAYPMLVPSAFALTHWAAGAVDEYLARFVAALMGVGAIAAAGLVGRQLAGPTTGLAAAALVAATPIFGRWASTGYTDVPASLFAALTALMACHWWTTGDRRALALAGLFAGLAAWTKNSALLLLPGLAWLVVWRAARLAAAPAAVRDALAGLAIVGAGALAVAGPWYARSWIVFGSPVPPTMLVERAQPTLATLGMLLRPDQHFGPAGWMMSAALAYSLVRAARDARDARHVLLALVVPFLAAWWWLASYEARFLMVVVPLMAVLGVLMARDAHRALVRHGPRWWPLAAAPLAAVAFAVAAVPSLRKTIEHKQVLLASPWLDDAARHRVRLGGLYDLAQALNAVPGGSRAGNVPRIIAFHLDTTRFSRLAWAPLADASAAARDFDFLVDRVSPGPPWPQPPAGMRVVLQTGDGYRLLSASSGPAALDDSVTGVPAR